MIEINAYKTTKKPINDWTILSASVDGKRYEIQMVSFDEPSRFGINRGRISKLWVRAADGSETINYDRGWDMRPTTASGKALLDEIVTRFN